MLNCPGATDCELEPLAWLKEPLCILHFGIVFVLKKNNYEEGPLTNPKKTHFFYV